MTRTRVLFCDFLGLPKGKYVQPDLAKSGDIGFAACALSVSFDRDLLNIPGTGLFDGIPDMKLYEFGLADGFTLTLFIYFLF